MKKLGHTCDYTVAKNDELVECFKRLVHQARVIDLDKIFKEVAESEASRFFISEERAYELISSFRHSGEWNISNSLRCEMMDEIYRRVEKRLEKRAGLTLRDAVYEVVNSRAPKFYLTPRSCRTLIYDRLSVRREERRRASGGSYMDDACK